MLLGLISAKGAPGVTTSGLAIAAAAIEGLLVEFDPSGGSIECWTDGGGEPGLPRVASGLRRSAGPHAIVEHIADSPRGVRSILAPTAGPYAESSVAMAKERLGPALRQLDMTCVLDCGRWSRSQPTAERVSAVDVLAVVCAPTLQGVEAARWAVAALEADLQVTLVALVVGEKPYSTAEIEAAIGVRAIGPLPWDQRGVASLLTRGAGKAWQRSNLAGAARTALADISEIEAAGKAVSHAG